MSVIQLRTFPGLWVGRRQIVQAAAVEPRDGRAVFRCGACETMIHTDEEVTDLREVVVRCGCGEYNQV